MSDKLHIGIKDFQSLKKADILLTPGITVITGATNNGKSAIIRAIDSAIFNLGDDSMVRGGQRYYGINLSNDSHNMLMARDNVGKNEKTAYQFDGGSVQKKVGRGQLEEVSRMFNIREVKMNNGTKMKINFWYQNDKPFLMDKTSGQLYEFLSMSSCDSYAKVLKVLGSDIKAINSDINTLTTEIDTYKGLINDKRDFISDNEGFDDVYESAIRLDGIIKDYQNICRLIEEIDEYSTKIHNVSTKIHALKEEVNSLGFDSIECAYNNIKSMYGRYSELNNTLSMALYVGDTINNISKTVKDVNEKFNCINNAINGVDESIKSVDIEYGRISSISDVLHDVSEYKNNLQELDTEIHKIKSSMIDVDANCLVEVSNMDTKLLELYNVIGKVESLSINIKSIQDEIRCLKEKISSSNVEFESLKKDIGYCPYCGREFF